MDRKGLQEYLEQFPADAPVAFAHFDTQMPGPDLLPDNIIYLEPEHIAPGVEEIRESYQTPNGKIKKAPDFIIFRPPIPTNPFAF